MLPPPHFFFFRARCPEGGLEEHPKPFWGQPRVLALVWGRSRHRCSGWNFGLLNPKAAGKAAGHAKDGKTPNFAGEGLHPLEVAGGGRDHRFPGSPMGTDGMGWDGTVPCSPQAGLCQPPARLLTANCRLLVFWEFCGFPSRKHGAGRCLPAPAPGTSPAAIRGLPPEPEKSCRVPRQAEKHPN